MMVQHPMAFMRPTSYQQFPASIAAWGTAWPSVATPTSLWLDQDAAFPLVDVGPGATNMSQTGGGTFTFLQTGDPNGRLGVKASAVSSSARVAASTTFQISTTGIVSGFCRFGGILLHATDKQPVIGKRARAALAIGWRVIIQPVTGYLVLEICDGVTEVTATIAENHGDRGFYNVMFVVNRTTQIGHIYSSKTGAHAQVNIAALGTLANGIRFHIGDVSGSDTCIGTVWDYHTALSAAEWTADNFYTMSAANMGG